MCPVGDIAHGLGVVCVRHTSRDGVAKRRKQKGFVLTLHQGRDKTLS